jgi:hypothetical protein
MKPMKILVCGGRDYTNRARVYAELDALREKHDVIIVIQGGAQGADRLARGWCIERHSELWNYHADWEKHGKAAGPIRNQRMLDDGKPDLVLAFPGGRGTADMVKRAEAAGVAVCTMSEDACN